MSPITRSQKKQEATAAAAALTPTASAAADKKAPKARVRDNTKENMWAFIKNAYNKARVKDPQAWSGLNSKQEEALKAPIRNEMTIIYNAGLERGKGVYKRADK